MINNYLNRMPTPDPSCAELIALVRTVSQASLLFEDPNNASDRFKWCAADVILEEKRKYLRSLIRPTLPNEDQYSVGVSLIETAISQNPEYWLTRIDERYEEVFKSKETFLEALNQQRF